MATWTAPTTRASGALITATIWNTDLVENLKYLKDAPVIDTAVIIGAATTSGIRLDLESGTLAVREGDDSAYAPLIASVINIPSAGSINFASSDVTITHSANTLTFGGASSGYIFNDGNLGLGVTPSAWVDDKAVQLPQGSISSGYEYGISLTANAYRSASNVWRYTSGFAPTRINLNNGGMQFLTAPSGTAGNAISFTQAMTLDASGNLLVGTTSGTSGNGAYGVFGNSSSAGANKWAAFFGTNSSSSAAASNFGLTIGWNKSGGGGESNIVYGVSEGSAPALAFSSSDGTNTTERLRITSGGNVAIGATAKFYLDGVAGTGDTYISETTANIIDVFAGGQACSFQTTAFTAIVDNNLNLGYSTSFRWKAVYAVNGTIQTSDARRKRDIEPSDLGSDFLRAIAPVSFLYEDMPNRRYGLIAQDIIAAANGRSLEGIITQDDDENGYYGLNYAAMVTPLVSGWQEHDSRIAALEAKIAALEARLN